MTQLVTECPRCKTRNITCDILGSTPVSSEYGWQTVHEVAIKCTHCHKLGLVVVKITTYEVSSQLANFNSLTLYKGVINDVALVGKAITQRDAAAVAPPEMTPEPIDRIFTEGSSSLSADCFNAAGSMFRLCLDLTTKKLLPEEGDETVAQPNRHQRKWLADRLIWLFENGRLPRDLEELARCVREHGTDGAHDGTLTREDAEDLMDFTTALLERVFTEPGRIEAANRRRAERHRKVLNT